MVKCACGREFENLGKLIQHLNVYGDDHPRHLPDRGHEATVRALNKHRKVR